MTQAQEKWLNEHPDFEGIGPPRSIKFEEWGSLHADGTYERLDNAPRKPIQVGTGAIGVAVVERTDHEELARDMDGFDRAFLADEEPKE